MSPSEAKDRHNHYSLCKIHVPPKQCFFPIMQPIVFKCVIRPSLLSPVGNGAWRSSVKMLVLIILC